MNESEQYVADCIRGWVWSGFYSADDALDMLDDVIEEECDRALLERFVHTEFARKREAESGWPAQTDCDRLDAVFAQLDAHGICALANAGYDMSDGIADASEIMAEAPGRYRGYCFYHGQDVERAVDGGGLTMAFGALVDQPARQQAVGREVAEALTAAGFKPEWDGSAGARISLPAFDWKRRAA